MTHNEFISLVQQPELVTAEYTADLREMVERYPYFASARLLFAKSLQQSHSVHFAANLKLAALYCANRRWLYYYIHPEKNLSTEPYRPERVGKSAGDYFDMLDGVEREGGDTKQSLKNLAERLKSARSLVMTSSPKAAKEMSEPKEINKDKGVKDVGKLNTAADNYFPIVTHEISENTAKKLIRERKYKEAIEILTQLNLNNPKKSVYFADQIRFLEKVIVNSKK